MSDQYPRRNPLACGALGRYDPMLVAEIGRRLASEMSTDEGSGTIVEARRTAVAPVAWGPVVCTLSGGWDSRLPLCLLAEHGRDGVRAVTVSPDNGHRREEALAAAPTTSG